MFYTSQEFIAEMIQLIKECNEIVLDIYNTDFSVEYKKDESPLTIADTKCNKYICNYLKKYQDILIISEENKTIDYQIRKKYDYCWLIDPIDGTKEFVKKNGQFTINIGLAYIGTPVFGIVSIPVTGEIYYGAKDLGSYKIDSKQNIQKLEITNITDFTTPSLNIVASVSHINNETKELIELFNQPNIVSSGSSIKLLLVADSKADVYPRLGPTSEWDTCAAHAVVKYAGGTVTIVEKDTIKCLSDFMKTRKELIYNKSNLLNPYFIVC